VGRNGRLVWVVSVGIEFCLLLEYADSGFLGMLAAKNRQLLWPGQINPQGSKKDDKPGVGCFWE
jgi:hypothetical protein